MLDLIKKNKLIYHFLNIYINYIMSVNGYTETKDLSISTRKQ